MRILQRARHSGRDAHCFVHRKLLLSVDALPKRFTFYIRIT